MIKRWQQAISTYTEAVTVEFKSRWGTFLRQYSLLFVSQAVLCGFDSTSSLCSLLYFEFRSPFLERAGHLWFWGRASCPLFGIIWEAVQAGLLYNDIFKHTVTLDSWLCRYSLAWKHAHQNKPCFLSFILPLAILSPAINYTNALIFWSLVDKNWSIQIIKILKI